MTPAPKRRFPTPDEVRVAFQQSIESVVEVLRQEVDRLFMQPEDSSGRRVFYLSNAISSKIHPLPPYGVRKAAFEVLRTELLFSHWVAELVSDRDGDFVSIRAAGRREDY